MQNIFKIDFTDFAFCILLCVYYANNVPKVFRGAGMRAGGMWLNICSCSSSEASARGLETALLRLFITELQICNFILKKAISSKLKYLNERKLQAT